MSNNKVSLEYRMGEFLKEAQGNPERVKFLKKYEKTLKSYGRSGKGTPEYLKKYAGKGYDDLSHKQQGQAIRDYFNERYLDSDNNDEKHALRAAAATIKLNGFPMPIKYYDQKTRDWVDENFPVPKE